MNPAKPCSPTLPIKLLIVFIIPNGSLNSNPHIIANTNTFFNTSVNSINHLFIKPKRARTKGRYKADDPTTKDVNEAWVGGKAPKKKKK